MSAKYERIINTFTETMQNAKKQKTSPYDTTAKVRRIENGTAWVHIPGGVDETPVTLTIAAAVGDNVQVRVANGRAFLVGNATAPPTDDTTALVARTLAKDASQTAETAQQNAREAKESAGIALASANGKNTVFFQNTTPTARVAGDTWFQTDAINPDQVVAMYRWNGTQWIASTLESSVIAYLDAAKITTGAITAITYYSAWSTGTIIKGNNAYYWRFAFNSNGISIQLSVDKINIDILESVNGFISPHKGKLNQIMPSMDWLWLDNLAYDGIGGESSIQVDYLVSLARMDAPVNVTSDISAGTNVSLGTYSVAYTIGKVCFLALNINFTANISSGATLATGLPKSKASRWCFAASRNAGTQSVSLRITSGGVLQADGAISNTGYYNASVVYPIE